MAVQNFDVVGAARAGEQYRVMRDKQLQQQQDDKLLRDLSPKIQAGDPAAYGQAAAVNPEGANAALGAGDTMARRAEGLIKMLEQADTSNPQAAQALWQQYGVPFARQFSQGNEPTANWAEAKPMVQQLKARIEMAKSQQTASQSAVQSTRVGRGEDGKFYYFTFDRAGVPHNTGVEADPNTQIVEGEGGFYGVNKRDFNAAPVQMGGNGQPPSGAPIPPGTGGQVSGGTRINVEGLPPEVGQRLASDVNAMHAAGVPADVIDRYVGSMTGQGTQPQSMSPSAGAQLRPAVKPREAPANFEWNEDRSALVPIPGGPADPNAQRPADVAKEEMAMRKELADLNKNDLIVTTAYSNVNTAAKNPTAQNDLALIFAYMKMLDPGSVVREGEFANAQNAAGIPDRVVNAYNRAISGERLNDQQRQGFIESARGLYNEATQRINKRAAQQAETAEAYGYDPGRATGMKEGGKQYRENFQKAGQLLQEARDAIRQGADKAKVTQRLRELGFENIAGRL